MGIHIQEVNIIVTHEVTNFIFPPDFFLQYFHDVSKGNQGTIWWSVNHTNNYFFSVPKTDLTISTKIDSWYSLKISNAISSHKLNTVFIKDGYTTASFAGSVLF